MQKNLFKILFTLFFLIVATTQSNAFWGSAKKIVPSISKIFKGSKTFSDEAIIKYSNISDKDKGTKELGRILGRKNLPNEVLEDTFLRIAIYQKKLTRRETKEMFSGLSKVPGFRQTVRKIIGNSNVVTAGHLNELKIANSASKNGFEVLSIGEKFKGDPAKGLTDIDVLLKKGNKVFAIEAKNYASMTKLPIDKFRADLNTLVIYKNKNSGNIIPIFSITNKPINTNDFAILSREAEKRGVQLIVGTPMSQIHQMDMLGKIL